MGALGGGVAPSLHVFLLSLRPELSQVFKVSRFRAVAPSSSPEKTSW